MSVHLNRPSGEPRPGARALCGVDGGRHGVLTTYSLTHVTCAECRRIWAAVPGHNDEQEADRG